MGVTKKYITAIIGYISCLVLGLLVLFTSIENQVVLNSRQTLTTNINKQAIHLKSIMDMHFQYLNEIAEFIGNKEINIEDIIETLNCISSNTDLGRIAYIQSDGTAYYDDGNIKNVAHREYFQRAMQGEQNLSNPLESSVDQKTKVILSVPIYDGEEVIGVLGGSYDVSKLSHTLFDDLFDGQGYTLILDNTGNIITKSNGKKVSNSNIITYYKEYLGENKKKIKQDFKKNKNGFILINNEYFCYTPSGFNDWMIAYIVPIKAVESDYSFITEYAINILVIFVICTSLLIWYLFHLHFKEKKYLSKAAHTDALTDLYNKNYTQTEIENILVKHPLDTHCFLILDLDNFKSINDTYGHAQGDVVLGKVGSILKDQFRQEDIIGRIGGDEFVIFMVNVENQEIVEERIQNLLNAIHSLHIDQIQDYSFSMSIGACFYPDSGNDFMHLYKNADKELYKIKQTTKNGYSIKEAAIK